MARACGSMRFACACAVPLLFARLGFLAGFASPFGLRTPLGFAVAPVLRPVGVALLSLRPLGAPWGGVGGRLSPFGRVFGFRFRVAPPPGSLVPSGSSAGSVVLLISFLRFRLARVARCLVFSCGGRAVGAPHSFSGTSSVLFR